MNSTKSYKVSILGETYSLVSDESEEQVLKAAQYVDDMMRGIAGKNAHPDVKKLAVLVAIQAVSRLKHLESSLVYSDQKKEHLIDFLDREVLTIARK